MTQVGCGLDFTVKLFGHTPASDVDTISSVGDRTFKTVPGIRRVCIFPGNQPIRFIVT